VDRGFDLLGDPIPAGRGEPGRTGHVPTAQNAKKIRLLLVSDWTVDQIAAELGISAPTLRKHYFRSGKINLKQARQIAIAEVRGRTLLQLDQAAEAGKVAAIKAIRDIVDKAALADLPKHMQPGKRREEPKGKKVKLKESALKPDGGWAQLGLPGSDRTH
jgi:hypothetical protein